jgi:signal transduction histidine kinase
MLSSLSNRIFLASALLAVLSIAVAVFVVNRVSTGRAEAELEHNLSEAGTLLEQFQAVFFEHLVREARLIADLPKLKAAVSVDHKPTVEPLAADYRRQIDADLFVVTNRRGVALGLSGDPGVPVDQVGTIDGIQRALIGQETVAFWARPTGLLQVVSVPIFIDPAEPEILGTLSAGVSVDQRLADRIKAITRSEVVFARGRAIQASTLDARYRPQLSAALDAEGISRIVLGGEEFVAVRRLLSGNRALAQAAATNATAKTRSGAVITSSPEGAQAPVALILRSRTEHLRFLRTLHSALLVTALFAVVVATLLSYAVARTISRPLGALTATMREMAATGDLTRVQAAPVPPSRWEDEDARVLAGAFRSLTESLARFQREAAQREKLSSLGRLSTVVAHEIRNPLMIIKASLRTLRRAAVPVEGGEAPEAAGAINDIEGEVTRLNRLVNEVLDYARPIRFDLAPTDLNALCRDAAAATLAGHPPSLISVEPDVTVGELTTDPERLRLVLVNVLANARDAVLDDPGAVPDASHAADGRSRREGVPAVNGVAPVVLRTECPGPRAVRITVSDRGRGIAAEDLARVFDPFFTTKRTGSGLGLAIAKNIVDGLGGSIVVASDPPRGTTVQITLPRTPETRA